MNVILLKDVEKLGLRGDVVDVKRGYARNFLLPRKLAEVATPGRVAEVKRIEERKAAHDEASADPPGSLCGSVTTTDIADEIWRPRKIRIDRRKIGVDHIKRIGRYSVPV